MTDLSQMSPPEIDVILADLHERIQQARHYLASAKSIGERYPNQRDDERIETLHAAKAWLTDEAWWNRGGSHPSFPSVARRIIAEAVAAKTGETIEVVLAAAKARAEKRN